MTGSNEGGTGWSGGENRGPVRSVVDSALVGLDMDVSHQIVAVLARSCADLVDRAASSGDDRLWLSASGRLMVWLGQLGVMGPASSAGVPGDSSGGVVPVGLADALGAGPEVRDPQE